MYGMNKNTFTDRMKRLKMRLILLAAAGGGFGLGFGIARAAERIGIWNITLSGQTTMGSLIGITGFVAGNIFLMKFSDFYKD